MARFVYDFLFTFYSNYGFISFRVSDFDWPLTRISRSAYFSKSHSLSQKRHEIQP